jgi:phosphatidylglycerol:prolipoprotein diacylglycerol transferase
MNLLAYYIHHLNPVIVSLGPLKPRWYGFAYLMGFLGAYLLTRKNARDGMLRLHPDRVPDLVLNVCIAGVLIGGRLGFALFYDLPDVLRYNKTVPPAEQLTPMLWNFSSQFPFWGLLRVWDGGMAAHGGVLFTILALIAFAWLHNRKVARGKIADPKVSLVNIGDAACMVVPIGLCFGRIANFINGELYGHPTTVPWAVKFPSEIWSPTNGKPTISPESIQQLKSDVAGYVAAHPLDLTARQVTDFLANHHDVRDAISAKVSGLQLDNPQHLDTARQMIGTILGQDAGFLERADLARWWEAGQSAVGNVMHNVFDIILPARHPSQLYESLLEGVLLFIICWTIGRKWKKDGMASGAFLTLYPVMRIIGEQFRVGDSPQKVLGVEMSLGVLYSLLMFVGGAVYWAYWIRKDRCATWVPPTALTPSAVPSPSPPPATATGGPANP